MHGYGIEDSEVLRPVLALGFYVAEMVLLTTALAIGILLSNMLTGDAAAGSVPDFSVHEALRSFGASVLFMILSGYFVTVAGLVVLFRKRLLSLAHASWLVLLFLLHSGFFLFYLRASEVSSSSVALIATGAVCVGVAAAAEYMLWRRWLLPRSEK